jgi:hypothetical protein
MTNVKNRSAAQADLFSGVKRLKENVDHLGSAPGEHRQEEKHSTMTIGGGNANGFRDIPSSRWTPDSRHLGTSLGSGSASGFVGQAKDPDCRRRALGGA